MDKYNILKILRLSFLYIGLILLMVYCKYYQSPILMIIGIVLIVIGVICYILSFIVINKEFHDNDFTDSENKSEWKENR